jgi:hypothetical protein
VGSWICRKVHHDIDAAKLLGPRGLPYAQVRADNRSVAARVDVN